LFNADFFRDPYPVYDKLRANSPVQRLDGAMGNLPTWLITGYAEARAALTHPGISKDTRRFRHIFDQAGSKRNINPAVSATMLATDPPDHTRLRKLVAKAFTTDTVNALRPRIQQITDDLLGTITPAGHADLIQSFAAPLPVTVISELLGVPESDRTDLRQWSNDNFAAGDPAVRDHASHAITGYMAGLINAKRARPGDDLLSALIAARDDTDRLSEHELVSLAVLLLIAGHETTTSLIGNAVLALLLNPEQHSALLADPSLLPTAIDEFLRHDPPVATATIRFTTEPITIAQVNIPADQVILVSLGAANNDPARFFDPARLDVTRDSAGHLAFGHGIHFCIGARLARVETEIALSSLLARLPGLQLTADLGDLQWRHSRIMRGLESLPVRW
jgi:cytochrome P450